MRKPFEPQMTIGTVPMPKISFDIYCRHELVPILMALKHIYSCEPKEENRVRSAFLTEFKGE